MSQTVDIKTSWYQEIYSSNRPNARSVQNIPKIRTRASNNNNNTIATKGGNKNISLSQKSPSCCDVTQEAINIKKSVLAKTYFCKMSSNEEFECVMANSESQHHRHQAIVDNTQELTHQGNTNMSSSKCDDNCPTSKTTSAAKIGSCFWKQGSPSNLNMNQKIYIFGGIDPYAQRNMSNSQGMDVLYYDKCENAWKYLSNMPGSRHHHSAAVYRGKIYVIGGTRPPLPPSAKPIFETSVWSFDPNRLEWHNEGTLPQPRRDFGLIAYDNDAIAHNNDGHTDGKHHHKPGLFIIGGEGIDGTSLSSVLHYNVEIKLWSEEAPLNIGRYGLASAIVVNTKNNAEIWIAGGVCGQEKGGLPIITDSMESYNLASESSSWMELAIRLRIPRLFARFCTARGGKDLYIVGGIGLDSRHTNNFKSLSSLDRFEFQEKKWIHLTDMIMSRHGHDVVLVKDDILIFGGVSGCQRKTLNSVECFSTKTGNWLYDMVFLPSPLSGLAAVVTDCNFP